MSIYSGVLREREASDTASVIAADEALINGTENASAENRLENTKTALCVILRRFGIEPAEVRCCRTAEELLDAMLDPENIMYEKFSVEDGW